MPPPWRASFSRCTAARRFSAAARSGSAQTARSIGRGRLRAVRARGGRRLLAHERDLPGAGPVEAGLGGDRRGEAVVGSARERQLAAGAREARASSRDPLRGALLAHALVADALVPLDREAGRADVRDRERRVELRTFRSPARPPMEGPRVRGCRALGQCERDGRAGAPPRRYSASSRIQTLRKRTGWPWSCSESGSLSACALYGVRTLLRGRPQQLLRVLDQHAVLERGDPRGLQQLARPGRSAAPRKTTSYALPLAGRAASVHERRVLPVERARLAVRVGRALVRVEHLQLVDVHEEDAAVAAVLVGPDRRARRRPLDVQLAVAERPRGLDAARALHDLERSRPRPSSAAAPLSFCERHCDRSLPSKSTTASAGAGADTAGARRHHLRRRAVAVVLRVLLGGRERRAGEKRSGDRGPHAAFAAGCSFGWNPTSSSTAAATARPAGKRNSLWKSTPPATV